MITKIVIEKIILKYKDKIINILATLSCLGSIIAKSYLPVENTDSIDTQAE
jgi:hypothetical protein